MSAPNIDEITHNGRGCLTETGRKISEVSCFKSDAMIVSESAWVLTDASLAIKERAAPFRIAARVPTFLEAMGTSNQIGSERESMNPSRNSIVNQQPLPTVALATTSDNKCSRQETGETRRPGMTTDGQDPVNKKRRAT